MHRNHALLAAALTAAAGTAAAQYTHVKSPPRSEMSHAQILAGALGESFGAAGKRDLASDSFYADRIKDSHDQIWGGGHALATVIGKQAGYGHTFGYVQDGDFNALLRTEDIGESTSVKIDGLFEWALHVDEQNTGDLWRSRKSKNRDHRDHMVTYAIYEQDHLTGFALFFEDLHKHHSDKDFNDAAVLLSLVPTPQAAGLALAGLGGVGLTAARRRRNS